MTEEHDHTKKVDEAWKDAAKREQAESPRADTPVTVDFAMFITGLMMEGLVALGKTEHPISKKKEFNATHAQFVIDTIAMLKDKTRNNLVANEADMIEAALYELRMLYVDACKQK